MGHNARMTEEPSAEPQPPSFVPVASDEPADMALVTDGTDGLRVFAAEGVAEYRLTIATPGEGTTRFAEWLTSTPGRSAIEGFPRGGPPKYTTDLPVEVVQEAPEITGDVALGSRRGPFAEAILPVAHQG